MKDMKTPLAILGLLGLFLLVIYYLPSSYSPLDKEFDFEGEQLTIVVNITNRQTIQEKFIEATGDTEAEVLAFANLYPEDKECVIYTLPVRHQKDYGRKQLLGHELLHCIYGRWHPGNEDY